MDSFSMHKQSYDKGIALEEGIAPKSPQEPPTARRDEGLLGRDGAFGGHWG